MTATGSVFACQSCYIKVAELRDGSSESYDMANLERNRHVGGIDGVAAELLTITAESGAFTKDIGEPGSGIKKYVFLTQL